MGGGQDKPAWTACPPGVKVTRVGGKITRDSLPPGGQAVQGGKINCYTGFCSTCSQTPKTGFLVTRLRWLQVQGPKRFAEAVVIDNPVEQNLPLNFIINIESFKQRRVTISTQKNLYAPLKP